MKRIIFFLIFLPILLFGANIKTPSDVYSYTTMLKKKVQYLREQENILTTFPTVQEQKNKYPRHVIQKALEVLSKINLYRLSKGYGEIYIPPYPAREITPSDVYDLVKRLDEEVTPFIKNRKFLTTITKEKFVDKTPNDVYRLLWSISLAFDSLLGIHGYTPTDVYALSEKMLKTVKYIAQSQNIYKEIEKPKIKEGLHPNHALYKSYELLSQISTADKKLWITPAEVPTKPHKVITPTDVYDAMQYNIAELQRIKHRLGLERYFKLDNTKNRKNPSDVVQNIEYAILLFPDFSLNKNLIQYPTNSLDKTPNDVYGATQEILKKLQILKSIKGISQKPKKPPFIHGLKPSHTYQKALEATEKSLRLKTQLGFFPSQIPNAPFREITPNEVYELVLRLDGITTFLLKKVGYKKSSQYLYKLNKKIYVNKTPSDVYNALWEISNQLDILLATEYTPNETYIMAEKIEKKMQLLAHKFAIVEVKSTQKVIDTNKTPRDVFNLTIDLFGRVNSIQKRLNMGNIDIVIPAEDNITPTTVYNALRILNASINEILIYMNIEYSSSSSSSSSKIKKAPGHVYEKLKNVQSILTSIFEDKNYDK